MVKLHSQIRRPRHAAGGTSVRASREGGYVLLTLLLLAAVLAFSLTVILPDTVFELKRDREQEMVHRGVQYSRALGAYYKKFGRYPTRLEDLESTNNLRFLRKRYKDPESKNQDFKLLHFGEVKLSLTGGIGGGNIPGATPVGGLNSTGGSLNGPGAMAQQTGLGGGSNNTFSSGSTFSATSNQPGTSSAPGTDPTQSSSQASGGTASDKISSQGASDLSSSQQQVFGGGPIIGVASANSKDRTIRVYNHKTKYREWQFVYDPALDRGGLITTPYQPLTLGFGMQNQPGQNGQPGQPGASSPFSSTPFGTNSNSNSNMNSNPPTPNTPAPGNPQQ